MPKHEFEKCAYDDPDVCEVCLQKNKTVFYKVVPNTTRCPRHGGSPQARAIENKKANMYRVQKWQRRMDELGDHDKRKSLAEEVSLLRMLLEETMKQCEDARDLLTFSGRIQSLTIDIQKLVLATDRLDKNMGQMMDKPTALKFASTLVEIVSEEIEDPEVLDRISHRVLEELRD